MTQLLTNGKIYVEKGVFAEAMVIEGDIIAFVGTNAEAEERAGKDFVRRDLEGKTVLPGMNDSHMHLLMRCEGKHQVDIDGVPSIGEMIRRCKVFLQEQPERCASGIHAVGWNQDLFEDGDRLPNRHDLDQISTEIPIVLERVCGHIAASNTKAIEMLGIDGSSPQFPDGEFFLGEDGYPNGIYTENAVNVVKGLIPDFSLEEKEAFLSEGVEYCLRHGVTSVQTNDVGTEGPDREGIFRVYHNLFASGKGRMRIRHQVAYDNAEQFAESLKSGEYSRSEELYPEGSLLTLGPLKLFADGSLGARTALMKDDYADDPGNRGVIWMQQEEMNKCVELAAANGIQVLTHAIGNQAVNNTLEAYEHGMIDGENKLRHVVNHCQVTDPETIDRIARDDAPVTVQPIFLQYDLHIVEDRCGKALADTSYAFQTMYQRGIHEALGTDCPVEDCNPFPNIYTAVTRRDLKGEPEGGYNPRECMDVSDAIDAYTLESAYVEFMEDRLGRLKPGYLADLIVLDKDIFTCDPMEIRDILPVLTMVGGKVEFDAAF